MFQLELKGIHCHGRTACLSTPQSQRTVHTHSNVGEGCSHHEIKDSGLPLDNVCRRKTDPQCRQHKQDDGREKRQQGLIHRTVLQGVIPVRPKKIKKNKERVRTNITAPKHTLFNRTSMKYKESFSMQSSTVRFK